MTTKPRITAISYLNTIPFVYGINKMLNAEDYELTLEVPAISAEKIKNNEADIGLIPVAAISGIDNISTISDYCIASDGKVASVLLISNIPLHKISRIHLDKESRTSVILAKILARNHWKISPEWISISNEIPESMIVIGDKAFNKAREYKYIYDLSEEWKVFTGLPFVFACWVARNDTDKTFIQKLNAAFEYGLSHRKEAIEKLYKNHIPLIDPLYYLNKCILYNLTEDCMKSLELFKSHQLEIESFGW